jgi:hypothetical protein
MAPSFVSAFPVYFWAGVYTYYQQLEDIGSCVPRNLLQNPACDKPTGRKQNKLRRNAEDITIDRT